MVTNSHGRKHCSSRDVKVGDLVLGGGHPIRIQSMTKTDTRDVQATVAQCIRSFEAGADYMRIAVPDKASVHCFKKIKKHLAAAGFNNPLVADIHYRPELAVEAAQVAHKIRINPGNYGTPVPRHHVQKTGQKPLDESDKVLQRLKPLIDTCKENGTAIRIGTNAGSLPARFLERYGKSPAALVESSIEYIRTFEALGFYDTVVSLKASRPLDMIASCLMMKERMLERDMLYPMHIGVTEAGVGSSGRIKSALGIISLLHSGIGDTIRVSLTESPENEIVFAKKITDQLKKQENRPSVKRAKDGRVAIITSEATDPEELMIDTITQYVNIPPDGIIRNILLEAPRMNDRAIAQHIAIQLMQATGLHVSDTEFISCPACVRTAININNLTLEAERRLSGHPGLRIAIMGCMVNGPGEMADADFGLIGNRHGSLNLYKKKQIVHTNLEPDAALRALEHMVVLHQKSGNHS